jgi:hypothetical protein
MSRRRRGEGFSTRDTGIFHSRFQRLEGSRQLQRSVGGGSFGQVCAKKLALEDGLRLEVKGSGDFLSRLLISDCTLKDPAQRPTASEAAETLTSFAIETGR